MSKSGDRPGAPATVSEMLERLDHGLEGLPKRLRQCAQCTRRHLHLLAVSTVSEMAAACDVAPSVYMRFCQALGFTGYSELQALFRANFTDFRPNYKDRLARLDDDGPIGTDRLLADFAEAGHRSLLNLTNTVTNDRIHRIATGLSAARVVHMVGLRRAFAVVSNMAYMLDKLSVPAMLHGGAGLLGQSGMILPGDAVFAATFSPFSQETVRLAELASESNVPVFGLSDSEHCPLIKFAQEVVIVHEDEVGGFRSLNAAMTLATALAVSVAAMRRTVDLTQRQP